MTTKLITEHKDYLLLLDEPSKNIKEGYFYHPKDVIFPVTPTYIKGPISSGIMSQIIAHLPLNNALVLEGLPSLPELPKQEEDDTEVEYEAEQWYQKNEDKKCANKKSYMEGLKAASKKWSKEDVEDIIKNVLSIGMSSAYEHDTSTEAMERVQKWMTKKYPKSLSPTLTPIGFEPEYEIVDKTREWSAFSNPLINIKKELKIVNGVLQGKWIFK